MTARQRVKQGAPPPQATTPRIAGGVPPWGWWLAAAIAILAVFALDPRLRDLAAMSAGPAGVGRLRAVIAGWGPWAPAASVALMVAHTVLPFPAELLTAANGAVFGFWGGLLVSWTGAMLAACLAFGVARGVGRAALSRAVPARHFARIDGLIAGAGWEIALVLRLMPVVSFNLVNFALGLTELSWPTYLWTTAVGILPAGIAAVAVGYGAGRDTALLRWALLALAAMTAAGLAARRRLLASSRR